MLMGEVEGQNLARRLLTLLKTEASKTAESDSSPPLHDPSQYRTAEDTWRKKRSGQEVLKAALVEVKGDWKQMYQCFGVPYWKRAPEKPLCWRCTATKQSLATESGPAASWLQPEHRLGHFQALERMLADGGTLSPIFSIPFMDMKALRIDWLHCADQGVASVFLGGLFHS